LETPEGIMETPLRIPYCSHVFGDHCLKKWLEDSDKCPYCRYQLPSEKKVAGFSVRTILQMLRRRGERVPAGSVNPAFSKWDAELTFRVSGWKIFQRTRP
jgi:hypothetical protein